MDSLISVVPVAPTSVLVACLAGFIFLYRAWPHLSIRNIKQPGFKPFDTAVAAAADSAGDLDDVGVVSKESEFPADWWTGKETYELERRALFSKVSKA